METPGFDSDRLWQAVIEASPTAMIALDGDGNVRLWNPAAVRLFGWTREEAMDRRFPPAPLDHQEEFPAWLAGVMRANPCLNGRCAEKTAQWSTSASTRPPSLMTRVATPDPGG